MVLLSIGLRSPQKKVSTNQGNKVEPIALQSGQVAKEHYGYEKNGSGVRWAPTLYT